MTDLIIDTDVALGVWHEGRPRDIDDGFAIVEAINNPDLNLLGVTCVYGNGPIDEVYRVASELVELKQVGTPVLRGAEVNMDASSKTNDAVEFLAKMLRQQRCTIAAIGPLTNIGLLIHLHPDVISNIDELIVVAGRSKDADFYIGDAGPVRDFNFENDVTATELVLAAGVPTVLTGFELTSQVCITQSDLETIKNNDGPTAQYFYDNSQAWCNYWTRTFPVDDGFHPWDSATIAWLIDRSMFLSESRGHKIQRGPDRLECDTGFPGPHHTYCTGFVTDGASRFVQTVVEQVY
jgi:inosine-uridine nucleoside N-ribohydrolase